MPKRVTREERFFCLPGEGPLPESDAGESLCWVLASAEDFEKVNKFAEKLQVERRPDRGEEIKKHRYIITRVGNEMLDLRVNINIARAERKEREEAQRAKDQEARRARAEARRARFEERRSQEENSSTSVEEEELDERFLSFCEN